MGDLNRSVISALVAFDQSNVSLEDAILARYNAHLAEKRHPGTEIAQKLSIAVLPTFVGSLNGVCAYANRNYERQVYHLYNSTYNKQNISVQLLLLNLMNHLKEIFTPLSKPFAWPTVKKVQSFTVPSS